MEAKSSFGTSHCQSVPDQSHPFAFTGSGAEYAKIFYVNLALTILTLGFYGPWAKVRKQQYIHSNTVLAGSTFEYTANPIAILKGRLIVLGVCVVLYLVEAFPIVYAIALILVFIFSPKMILQTLRFRARNTAYRGVRFHFEGDIFSMFHYFCINPILCALTFGLLIPWSKAMQRRYQLSQLSYGTARFASQATVGGMWRAYLIGLAAVIASVAPAFLVFVARAVIGSIISVSDPDSDSSSAPSYTVVLAELIEGPYGALLMALTSVLAYFLIITCIVPLVQGLLGRVTWDRAQVGDARIAYRITTGGIIALSLRNGLLLVVTLGLAYPWCAMRALRYKISRLSLETESSLDSFVGIRREEVHALGDQASDIFNLDVEFSL